MTAGENLAELDLGGQPGAPTTQELQTAILNAAVDRVMAADASSAATVRR
ncbi:hypothetical protein OIU35_19120 [Boseaceae bacterium BT-24-1]|nr:hypothetical protein [Boseaceae bacterium BT-24-1]